MLGEWGLGRQRRWAEVEAVGGRGGGDWGWGLGRLVDKPSGEAEVIDDKTCYSRTRREATVGEDLAAHSAIAVCPFW